MADFPGLILTRAGRQILTRALIGQPLTFTRAAVGTGQAPADAEGLTALVDERRSLAIAKMDTPGDGTASVEVVLTNAGVEQGFFVREIGLFARDPATDEERLYAYANAGDRSDFLPAAGGASLVEQIIRLITVIDQAETVTAEISDSLVLATQADLDALRDQMGADMGALEAQTAETLDTLRQAALGRVSLDGPGTVMPGASHSFTITDYHALAVYEASASLGTLTRDGATITLDVPADAAPGALDLTVTRDGAAQTVTLAVGEASVARPDLTAPAAGAQVSLRPLLATTIFAAYPANADTHQSTDWQVATDTAFTDIVWESLADTEALTSVTVPSGVLEPERTYHVRARHHGAALGASPWSDTRAVTTAAPSGDAVFTAPGVHDWVVPDGVTQVCVVCVGGGARGAPAEPFTGGAGGGGGGLRWANGLVVTPGEPIAVTVGKGGDSTDPAGGSSSFGDRVTAFGGSGYLGGGGDRKSVV